MKTFLISISIFFSFFIPRLSLAINITTVASTVQDTTHCLIFDGGNVDFATKIQNYGPSIYTGTLSTATWTQSGTTFSESAAKYIRNLACSRDSSGVTDVMFNRFGVPTTTNAVKTMSFDALDTASASSSFIDSTYTSATPLFAKHDSSDNLYVFFTSNGNYYIAYRASGATTWTIYDVDTTGTMSAGDMVLVEYLPVVALYDSVNKDVIIKSATDTTLSSWTTETAADSGNVGSYLSLDADANNNLHLVYMVDGGGSYFGLEYATNASGSWNVETVDTADSYLYLTGIEAVTPDLLVAAAYNQKTSSIVYFVRDSSGWSPAKSLETSAYNYLELGTNGGDVIISYIDASENLKVAYTICNDGAKEAFEECDDGNETDGDGCSASCETENLCGNGTTDTTTGEECDDGNATDGDGCTSLCVTEICGDGLNNNNATEECDDGNSEETDACLSTCKKATCGDGYIYGPFEECDDGNSSFGDGCDAVCRAEFAPIANAGPDQSIRGKPSRLYIMFYLDGSGSTDPDSVPDPLTYSWAITTIPATSTKAALINSTNVRPGLRADVRGAYVVTLTVTDADGYASTDTVALTVK